MRKKSKLFLLPAFVIYTVLMIVPIIGAFYLSLTNWNGISSSFHMIGFKNYISMLTDTRLHNALGVTFKITATVCITVNVLGLFIPCLLNKAGKLINALRSIFFMPYVISTVAISFIWLSILSYTGVLNGVLHFIGLDFLFSDFICNA